MANTFKPNALKAPMYGNCSVQHPDGTEIFRCQRYRADWYTDRDLATVLSEDPYVIRLKFQPKGYGHAHDENPFYLSEKFNRCCVCGSENNLTRHHCVPHLYRRFFPPELKKYSSHDVLPVCDECHAAYEVEASKLKLEIYGTKEIEEVEPEPEIDQKLLKAKKSAHAIILHGSKIPPSRLKVLKQDMEDYLGRELVEGDLEKLDVVIARKHPTRFAYSPQEAEKIVKRLIAAGELDEFMIKWRRHFVDCMKPQYLSPHWNVDYGRKVKL